MRWTRVCVDVADGGGVIGTSLERHGDDGELLEVVTSTGGPFDDPAVVQLELLVAARRRWGLQRTLF